MIKNIFNSIKEMQKRGKRTIAATLTAVLLMGLAVVPGGEVQAEEVPFVDISTALVSLSPQADEVVMRVAARHMPEGTALGVSVADGSICSVEWVKDVKEFTQLRYKRGEVLGETVVTVFVQDHPEIAAQILVTNKDAADSYVYEGDGSMDISGLTMTPIPYQVHAVSADPNGYFGLIYNNAAGEMKVLANKAGAYDGYSTIEKGAEDVTLHVIASGHWQIVMTPVLETAQPTQSGTGSLVSGRFKGDGEMHNVYCVNWAEKGNYIVWLYDINDNSRQLLANGVGSYGKTKRNIYLSKSHSYYLSIQSEGRWLVEFR